MVYVNVNAIIITSVILVILGIVIILFLKKLKKSIKNQQSTWREGKTEHIFPFLECKGGNVLYRRKEIYEKNSISCEAWHSVRIYGSQHDKKVGTWGFMGHILKIKDIAVREELFYHNNIFFKSIIPGQYQKTRKVAGHHCYTLNGELTEEHEKLVIKYADFARKLVVVFCGEFAIYFIKGKVYIIFSEHFERGSRGISASYEYIKTYINRILEEL